MGNVYYFQKLDLSLNYESSNNMGYSTSYAWDDVHCAQVVYELDVALLVVLLHDYALHYEVYHDEAKLERDFR